MFITVSELICGMIDNLWLKLNVWDYSNIPLNYLGQICLPFCMLWFVLSYLGALADEFVITHIFHEQVLFRLTVLPKRLKKIDRADFG